VLNLGFNPIVIEIAHLPVPRSANGASFGAAYIAHKPSATNARHCYTLKRKNVEVNVAPATVIVCVPAIETLIAV
jgi:hypothetical protein